MRKHTTYTDIRRICRLNEQGMSAQEISEQVFIDVGAVKKVLKVKMPSTPKKMSSKEAA